MSIVQLSTAIPSLKAKCEELSMQFNIPMADGFFNAPYILQLDELGLSLINTSDKRIKPFRIDFVSGKMAYRAARANLELLGKAIGIKKYGKITVLDAMAGIGRDGFLLACLGCDVVMLEKNPIVYLLLQDALERFWQTNTANLKIKLLYTDARNFIASSSKHTVIYLDPMFPSRNKSSLVKKEMQFLHNIVGEEGINVEELLQLSLTKAEKRVVLKRPLKANYLSAQKPNFIYQGKSIRFDIYLT